MNFDNIPEIPREPLYVDKRIVQKQDENFHFQLQQMTNTLICENFPFVAAMSLKAIDEELQQSLDLKINTLAKLKEKYSKKSSNINIVNDIIMDDFEMYISDNLQLMTNSSGRLLRNTHENDLVHIMLRKFEEIGQGIQTDKSFENIYKLLHETCSYTFTQLVFANEKQETLDRNMIYRIVQVWQIFQQFFKQFDYLDYLQNYYIIKNISDVRSCLAMLRLLIDIGPINCQ